MTIKIWQKLPLPTTTTTTQQNSSIISIHASLLVDCQKKHSFSLQRNLSSAGNQKNCCCCAMITGRCAIKVCEAVHNSRSTKNEL